MTGCGVRGRRTEEDDVSDNETTTDTPQAPRQQQQLSPAKERAQIDRGREMDATTIDGSIVGVFTNGTAFNLAVRMAEFMCNSAFLPESYRGNAADCLILIDYASRLGLSPIALAQGMHVVKGKPGLDGKMMTALLNESSRFSSRVRYEWRGDPGKPGGKPSLDYGCRVWMRDAESGEDVPGSWVDWNMVTGEGWDGNKKWNTMREQMFKYRAAAFFARAEAPDVVLGLQSSEELDDMQVIEGSARRMDRASMVNAALDSIGAGGDAQSAEEAGTGGDGVVDAEFTEKPKAEKAPKVNRRSSRKAEPEPPAADPAVTDVEPTPIQEEPATTSHDDTASSGADDGFGGME